MRQRFGKLQHGFSLVEGMVVIFIIMVFVGMAILNLTDILPNAKANSAMAEVVAQLRTARERAISCRCEVQVQFTGTNQITTTEIWTAGNPPPPVTYTWGNSTQFMVFGALPDTPMLFGNVAPVYIGGQAGGPGTMKFATNGAFIDAGNNFLNGTIFLGIAGKPSTARAVTILGATGRVRQYHWDGAQWQE
ncbi:MAG TPA: prepilin-type N-terminal cleavage/methylation domain-containing protein [Candidatus Dormibacteraeota bacterium]|nr:prepilin-type N-terminal cleavage/methylation domain-containing protein [Candidatus Dormibacteraeota bacterium]